MTDALVTWLSRTLDHAEEVARAAVSGDDPVETPRGDEWTVDLPGTGTAVSGGRYGTVVYDEGNPSEGQAAHIALHDPRAVLAKVEADRAVIREHVHDRHGSCALCYDRDLSLAPPGVAQNDVVPWPCPTLRWLAYGHRFDIEGFDPVWAPEGVGVDAN